MKVGRFVQCSLIAALTLVTAGCGRFYRIRGRVVLLPQLQSAAGMIVELTGKELPQGGLPVAGAKIKMMHDLDEQGMPKRGGVWEHDAVTGADGFFDMSDYAAPFKEAMVGLEVSKEGYRTVYATYVDYSEVEPQVFFVVLAPDARSNSGLNPTASQQAFCPRRPRAAG